MKKKMLLKILFLINLRTVAAVTMKVGLYNYIPDLANDNLQSYKDFIKSKWDSKGTGIELDLVVNKTLYDPYSNVLDEYLGDGENSFDLVEVDMARKEELKGKALSLNKTAVSTLIDVENFINASLEAVAVENDDLIGLPTFECGNFITQVQKGSEKLIYLKNTDYKAFSKSLSNAKQELVNNLPCNSSSSSKMERLLGGKIDDKRGWYLPFIYLDAVMDLESSALMDQNINNVIAGNPNATVIKRMQEFFGYFKDNCGKIAPTKSILENVVERKDAYLYGFSEKLSLLMEMSDDQLKGFNVLSPPFNDIVNTTTPLLYTDGIVVNKKKYNKAGDDYKKAIFDFIKFFTSDELRADIVMGKDLVPNRVRYLLVPNKRFYEQTTNQLYKKYYKIILNGLSAPALTQDQRESMQDVLNPLVFQANTTDSPKSSAVSIDNSVFSLTTLVVVLACAIKTFN